MPFEIEYAVDTCKIPIIASYPKYSSLLYPASHSDMWPKALADRIDNGTAKVIHIPFKKEAIADAISQFDFNNMPDGGLVYYTKETQQGWGYL